MHTPGPWEVGGPYPSVTVIKMVDPGCGGPDAEPPYYEPVAYIYDGAPDYNKPPPDVAIADARLIAAAPDLLAALTTFPGRSCSEAEWNAWVFRKVAAEAKATDTRRE